MAWLPRLKNLAKQRAKAKAEGAGCVVCGATALRRVATKGYCREHYQQAVRHAKRNQYLSDYGYQRALRG